MKLPKTGNGQFKNFFPARSLQEGFPGDVLASDL
jgi:hypothetical protein